MALSILMMLWLTKIESCFIFLFRVSYYLCSGKNKWKNYNVWGFLLEYYFGFFKNHVAETVHAEV